MNNDVVLAKPVNNHKACSFLEFYIYTVADSKHGELSALFPSFIISRLWHLNVSNVRFKPNLQVECI